MNGEGSVSNVTLASAEHLHHFYDAANWLLNHQDDRGGWAISVPRKVNDFKIFLYRIPEILTILQEFFTVLQELFTVLREFDYISRFFYWIPEFFLIVYHQFFTIFQQFWVPWFSAK